MSAELELLREARDLIADGYGKRLYGWPHIQAVTAKIDAALAQPAQADERDAPELCPTCGAEDGGTTCGMPNCGLLMGEPAQADAPESDRMRDALAAEVDALKQTLRDEIDGNLRLRAMGGARPDETMTAFLERVIRERDAAMRAAAPEVKP